jgi:tRNA A37 threonylcarbamoyladenosine synthetase subunit TsaC/SUA5/YrdC
MYVNKTLKDKIISNIPSTIVDIDEWKILRYGDTAKDVDKFFERYINVQK